MKWQLIETAKKEHHERVLLCYIDDFGDPSITTGCWWGGSSHEQKTGWLPDWHGDEEYSTYFIEPTHWAELIFPEGVKP